MQISSDQEINKLRELRKVLSILQSYGNVLVNGNVSAATRMTEIVKYFQDKGMDIDEISVAVDNLAEFGYPIKIN